MNVHQILPATATTTISSQLAPRPTPHILLVEDDVDLGRFNAEVLKRNGYHVDAAEDGALAWEALTARSYDLLITDNSMPKVTGIELLQKLHEANMTVPVIMATGVLPEWEFSQNPDLTPAATLLKPYTIPELLRAVRGVLHSTIRPRATATFGQMQYEHVHPSSSQSPL